MFSYILLFILYAGFFCLFSLSLGAIGWLRLVIMTLPDLLIHLYAFFFFVFFQLIRKSGNVKNLPATELIYVTLITSINLASLLYSQLSDLNQIYINPRKCLDKGNPVIEQYCLIYMAVTVYFL